MTASTNSISERLETSLIGFVERASKETATPEEVAVLPSVADVLSRILYQSY
ncbi:hypothetical protein [Carnobacterium divergens]|uniref:hypothetical protein n=1 Tax=Carnobacterium divergens TaxID=2748 RepID=UPI00159F20E4|nr:hypothetical protein [Carnobacterium divergens]